MIPKKIALGATIVLCLVQLFVAGSIIFSNETTIIDGTSYKFRTAPIDPNDPFRGKYITLDFEINMVDVPDAEDWKRGQELFGILTIDSVGYARIDHVQIEKPPSEIDYIAVVMTGKMEANGQEKIFIDLPFDRFYLPETKAAKAEEVYNSAMQDPETVTYALVSVKEGQAVVTDVLIGDQSITELIP